MILITGGLGYIGSHIAIELLKENFKVLVIDNLENSSINQVNLIEKAYEFETKDCDFFHKFRFLEGDLLNKSFLGNVFLSYKIDAVIHLAGLKSVEDSVKNPLNYYVSNVFGSINLLQAMKTGNTKKIIFSSSACVYAPKNTMPLSEDSTLGPINPYGNTKLVTENLLKEYHKCLSTFSVGILRYFNPIGSHCSHIIGDSPRNESANLMPILGKISLGSIKHLNIFGNDYATIDGTGVRDFIHVVDLARGHISALQKILSEDKTLLTLNFGTGVGYSVLQVVKMFQEVSKEKIPIKYCSRRAGDLSISYTNPSLAMEMLGWKAEKSLQEMCNDSWLFFKNKN